MLFPVLIADGGLEPKVVLPDAAFFGVEILGKIFESGVDFVEGSTVFLIVDVIDGVALFTFFALKLGRLDPVTPAEDF